MKEERIEAVKTWPEPKSVRDIQVFLGVANFYWRFIKNFNRIPTPLTSILRTTSESSDARSLSIRANDDNYNHEVGGSGAGDGAAGRKLDTDFAIAKANEASGTDFSTLEARGELIRLQKAFTETPILHHFDLDCHIQIETDDSGYAIGRVLS